MSEIYSEKFGLLDICDSEYHKLGVGWDYDSDINDEKTATFLFTPDMKNTGEHFHIVLNREQATNLRDWLNEYISDVSISTTS